MSDRRWTDDYGEQRSAAPVLDAWVDKHLEVLGHLAELTPDSAPALLWGVDRGRVPSVLFDVDHVDPSQDYLYGNKPRGLVLSTLDGEPELLVVHRHIERYERTDGAVLLVIDRDG